MAMIVPKYRGGDQGYAHYAPQNGEIVAINAVADPAAVAGVITPIGLVPLPSRTQSENRQPLTAVGESREQGSALGRRDCGLSMRHQVADAAFITYGIRNRSNPAEAGTRKGLKLLTVDMGVDSRYGDEAFGEQCVDSLINTWSVEYSEGQILQADTELWCTTIIDAPAQVRVAAATNVLIWSVAYFTLTNGAVELHPLFSRVRVGGTNNLERVNCRHQYGAEGSELKISRTPYSIKPRMEQINLSYQLHDNAPASLLNTADWGQIVLRAEHPLGTPNRRWFQITIDHQYINRHQRGTTAANQLISYSLDQAAYAVEMTSGTI